MVRHVFNKQLKEVIDALTVKSPGSRTANLRTSAMTRLAPCLVRTASLLRELGDAGLRGLAATVARMGQRRQRLGRCHNCLACAACATREVHGGALIFHDDGRWRARRAGEGTVGEGLVGLFASHFATNTRFTGVLCSELLPHASRPYIDGKTANTSLL